MTLVSKICTSCEEGRLIASRYEDEFQHNGDVVRVADLECYICSACGADPVYPDQIRRNQLRIADAKRKKEGLLAGSEIKLIREYLGLTQQEAAVLFGGGANAFSKYERGDVLQSVAMDRLLKATAFLPSVFEFLQWEADAQTSGERGAVQSYCVRSNIEIPVRTTTSRLRVVSEPEWRDAA